MAKRKAKPKQSVRLKERVEIFLNSNITAIKKISPTDVRNLFEDLQIYQTELENHSKEMQKTNAELRESEARYRLLADNVSDVIWTMDMEMNYTYFSPSITHLQGFSVEEALAMPPEESMPPDSLEIVMKAITEELEMHNKGQKPPDRSQTIEAEVYCKDGSTVWTEIEGNFLYDANGQPEGIIGITRDITERRKAEEVLKRSEMEYRLLAENVTDAICVIDLDQFVFNYVSPSVESVFGYTVEEFMNLNVYDLLIPDSADHMMEVLTQEIEKNKYGKAEPQRLELEVLLKDGLTSWMEVSARFLRDDKEHVTSILCVVRDVLERKKAEKALKENKERFQSLYDNAPDMYFTVSPDGVIISVNQFGADCLGYSKEELVENSVWKIVYKDDLKMVQNQVAEIFNQKLQKRELEFRKIRKDGSILWVHERTRLILDENDIPIELWIICRDVTIYKQAEKALNKTNERLEEKVKERTAEIQEKNTALKVLLNQRGDDKKKLEETMMSNVKELLIPNLTRLKSGALNSKQQTALNVLEANLNEIISPFANNVSSTYMRLTPTEIQIANFIKHGASSKDIADSLGLSQRTVDTHRYNIRKKIGIGGKGVNLRTYLLALT